MGAKKSKLICVSIHEKFLMDKFEEKLKSKGYKLQKMVHDGEVNFSTKYTKEKYNNIVINLSEAKCDPNSLQKKHYWFCSSNLTKYFYDTSEAKEFVFCDGFLYLKITAENVKFLHDKMNKFLKKEFGFTLFENKKIIIDYI